MRSWHGDKFPTPTLCGLLPGSVLLASLLATPMVLAQSPGQSLKRAAVHRANELTLAGLRPGRDTVDRALLLYKQPSKESHDSQMSWLVTCQSQTLTIDLDKDKKIQIMRTTEVSWMLGDCGTRTPGSWRTGRGLRVGDQASRVVQLYGEPDSRSPSTKDAQPLELMYYAFDWAGADVPQVMEVLCTRDKDGRPGRVVEITLAAPSL